MAEYYLAIDIGASGGRHILGHVENGNIITEEVYRFDNRQVVRNGHDCWDMENLRNGILDGLKAVGRLGKIPKTVGIDTWGVDFVLLNGAGDMTGDAVSYRDRRTDGTDAEVEKIIPFGELYGRTGIQKQNFNTIYQLAALKKEHPRQLAEAESLLMMPDYLNFCLTGVKRQEYTNATTSGLVNAREKKWDYDLISRLELPEKLFGELSVPGEAVGSFTREVRETVGFDSVVILPATHDTGSAFLSVPAKDDGALYISSGTWSLLGVENSEPILSRKSLESNFTNEGGAWYRFRYLKNIMGLWMIQSVRRELNGVEYVAGKTGAGAGKYADGSEWSFPALADEARGAEYFASEVNVNDPVFLSPDSMIDAVVKYCSDTGQKIPGTVGEIMQCLYRSLALYYKEAVRELSELTGKKYTSINIVGGGCRDMYLNGLTARTTGLPVYAGPVEGTAIGNLIVQFVAAGEFSDLREAREAVGRSFDIKSIVC